LLRPATAVGCQKHKLTDAPVDKMRSFSMLRNVVYIYNNYCALKGKITVVVVPTVRFNRRNFTHGFSCVLRMNVMTNNINRLVLLMEKQCVCCDVGKELLYAFCVKTELTF
jgi:hypothetical protein